MSDDFKGNNLTLYFNMVLGTIGTTLIFLAALRYLAGENDNTGYGFILFGFIFTLGYINFLEKRAGISRKLTWIRVIISILICYTAYFIYF